VADLGTTYRLLTGNDRQDFHTLRNAQARRRVHRREER